MISINTMAPNLTGICDMDIELANRVEEIGGILAYYILIWIHYLLGIPGHLILLIAFFKQMKQDSPYMYQVFVTVSEMLELQAWVLYVVTKKFLSGVEYTAGVHWFKQSYILMFFTGKMIYVIFQSLFSLSLLLSVAMTADRVFALAFPFKYKNIKERNHQITALIICVVIALGTNLSDNMLIITVGDHYEIMFNYEATRSIYGLTMGMLSIVTRGLCLIILFALNIALVRLYTKRYNKVNQISLNEAKAKQRKANEKTLVILTICQSIFQSTSVLSVVIFYTLGYTSGYFAVCIQYIVNPYLGVSLDLTDLLDLCVTILINKHFRKRVFSLFAGCRSNRVGAIELSRV